MFMALGTRITAMSAPEELLLVLSQTTPLAPDECQQETCPRGMSKIGHYHVRQLECTRLEATLCIGVAMADGHATLRGPGDGCVAQPPRTNLVRDGRLSLQATAAHTFRHPAWDGGGEPECVVPHHLSSVPLCVPGGVACQTIQQFSSALAQRTGFWFTLTQRCCRQAST